MRKKDYLTLAGALREKIALWSPDESPALGEKVESYTRRMSESICAASLARYLADHLSVDRAAFLKACGLKP